MLLANGRDHLQYARSLLARLALVALVAQLSASRNDEDQCRDAKNDSNTQCLMLWKALAATGAQTAVVRTKVPLVMQVNFPKRNTIFPFEAVNMKQQSKRGRASSSMK
jgi:hypothetical protein